MLLCQLRQVLSWCSWPRQRGNTPVYTLGKEGEGLGDTSATGRSTWEPRGPPSPTLSTVPRPKHAREAAAPLPSLSRSQPGRRKERRAGGAAGEAGRGGEGGAVAARLYRERGRRCLLEGSGGGGSPAVPIPIPAVRVRGRRRRGGHGLHGGGDRRLPHGGDEREPAAGRAGAQAVQLLLLAEPHGAQDHGGEGADPRALRARVGAAAAPAAGRDHRQVPGGAARPGPLRRAPRHRPPARAARLLPQPAPQHRPEGRALRRRGTGGQGPRARARGAGRVRAGVAFPMPGTAARAGRPRPLRAAGLPGTAAFRAVGSGESCPGDERGSFPRSLAARRAGCSPRQRRWVTPWKRGRRWSGFCRKDAWRRGRSQLPRRRGVTVAGAGHSPLLKMGCRECLHWIKSLPFRF